MKEVALGTSELPLEAASFLACVAAILELPLEDVPEPHDEADLAAGWTISRWLGGLGLGLVPVAEPGSFAWAGPWIARVRPHHGGGPRWLVMYGVPSGLLWDPSGTGADAGWTIESGYLIAAGDVALALPPRPAPPAGAGSIAEIWLAQHAGAGVESAESVRALAARGLQGDRYAAGTGTFPSGPPGSALTLIEAEVCEAFTPRLRPDEHRRNVVTRGIDLNALVGRRFSIGTVACEGRRLCEPCAVLEGYASRPVLRALVHRGGLRADVLSDGVIAVGDAIRFEPS